MHSYLKPHYDRQYLHFGSSITVIIYSKNPPTSYLAYIKILLYDNHFSIIG